MQAQEIKAISSENYLDEIIDSGWSIIGPRKDPDKNLRSAKTSLNGTLPSSQNMS